MRPPAYSVVGAFARNLALYPVILAHGFRRLAVLRANPTRELLDEIYGVGESD